MKVGIPTHGEDGEAASVAEHFGRAPIFTVVDTETGAVETVENRGKHHGGSESPPVILAEAGAEVVLVGNIGRNAVTRFEDRGVAVYRGASGTVAEAIEAWDDGALERVGPEDVHGHGEGHSHEDHDHSHGAGHDH